jgi:cobalt-zinc-cadmium efflux system outer membrane protein
VAGELDVVRSALAARRAQLATWLGVDRGRRLLAVADLSRLPGPVTAGKAGEKARVEHPAVAAARARVAALSENVAVERGARVPAFALKAFADSELDRRAYGVGLEMDLPIWNWNTGGIERSESMLAAGRERLRAERLEIETSTIEARSACGAGVTLAARYKGQILPRAESAAQTIERTYQLGEATLLEVIDARQTLLETKREFLDALVRAQIDCSRLRALTGEESP